MKLIDEKGRLFGRINVIDLGVILLVLIIAAVGVYKAAAKKGANLIAEETPFTMQIITREVLDNTLKQLPNASEVQQEKINIMEHPSGVLIGKVVKIEAAPAKREVETADGRVVLADVPNRHDVILTVEGKGVYNENQGLVVAGSDRKVGNSLYFKTNKMAFGGTIINIEVGNQ